MITLSNGLSFFRAPLAFLFCQENTTIRLIAVFLAMATDSIDGYLARKYHATTRFGAILDPTMDKFFVYFALSVLFFEGKVTSLEFLTMLSRDFFLLLYALTQIASGKWKAVVFRAIRWGKVTTALQFIVLIGLLFEISFPWYIFASFVLMGWLAFRELFQAPHNTSVA